MGKIDGLKEDINSTRFWLGVCMTITISLIAGLVYRYDKGMIDFIFYVGSFLTFAFNIMLIFLNSKLRKLIKQMWEA